MKNLVVAVGSVALFGVLACVGYLKMVNGSESVVAEAALKSINLEMPSNLVFEELPLALNEGLIERTDELLQQDAFLLRRYQVLGDEFDVFIAFWDAGNATQRVAAQHNPDICWVQSAGWKELYRSSRCGLLAQYTGGNSGKLASNSLLLAPIEYRLLETPQGAGEETQFHTYFWQVLEGEVKPIERVGPGNYWEYFKTIPDRIRAKRHPMWFIRIHSKTPLAPIAGMENEKWKIEKIVDVSSMERGAAYNLKPLTLNLKPADADENQHQHYLIDYPEVRELLMAIHKLTTGEQMANGK